MSDVVLIGIREYEIAGRQVFNTGLSTVGRGGNNYFCGHCGHQMMNDFDLDRMEAEIVFQCGACKGHNVKPTTE